jgi:predicted CxxxxCH...CXXCH cytochrome family protein
MTWHERAHLKDRRGAGLPASVLVAALVASAPAWADAPPGAASCSGCHGPATLGTAIPSLEGHAAADIVAQMQAFGAGQRPATVMGRIAKGFSEDETRAIAEWLANPEATRHADP